MKRLIAVFMGIVIAVSLSSLYGCSQSPVANTSTTTTSPTTTPTSEPTTPVTITISPSNPTLVRGRSKNFYAYNASSVNIPVTWSVTNVIGTIEAISSSTRYYGYFVPTKIGVGTVEADSGSLSGTTTITVVPSTSSLAGVTIGMSKSEVIGAKGSAYSTVGSSFVYDSGNTNIGFEMGDVVYYINTKVV